MDSSEWLGAAGKNWAAQWRRTDRSFAPLTEHLLARTRGLSSADVLDIGCGAGELAIAIARGRPASLVTGIDISPALIAVARERASNHANVEFVEGDAAQWASPVGRSADLLVSRHGVMFFDKPTAAFCNLAAQSVSGACLLFSCFRAPEENPFFSEVMRLLPDAPAPAEPDAPGPFAFADREHVIPILRAAGWEDVLFERFDFAMVVGAGEDPVADALAYFSTIGPAARAAAEMSEPARERFFARVHKLAANNCRDGVVALPAAAWIVTARRP